MTKSNYAKDRLNPRWQKKRLEIMKLDDFECIECGSGSKTLNVHHSYYISGRKPWQYPDWSLKTFCQECHKRMHERLIECCEDEYGPAEEPWETYLSWLDLAAPREILSEDYWDDMIEISHILKFAFGISSNSGSNITEVLREVRFNLQDKLEALP